MAAGGQQLQHDRHRLRVAPLGWSAVYAVGLFLARDVAATVDSSSCLIRPSPPSRRFYVAIHESAIMVDTPTAVVDRDPALAALFAERKLHGLLVRHEVVAGSQDYYRAPLVENAYLSWFLSRQLLQQLVHPVLRGSFLTRSGGVGQVWVQHLVTPLGADASRVCQVTLAPFWYPNDP